jgi:endonuclease YncB( thermonuclease family)
MGKCAKRIAVLLPFFLALSAAAAAEAVVHDGDTITLDGTIYRLDGIDAPELDQNCTNKEGETIPCGIIARDRLIESIGKHSVICDDRGPDTSYMNSKRRIGECRIEGESSTLNEWLVRQGLAFNFEPYAHGRFMAAQNDAQANHRGFWAGCFVMPRDFRRGNKRTAVLFGQSCGTTDDKSIRDMLFPADPRMPPGCTIKGKYWVRASITGFRGIYHMEGCRSYQHTTRVDRWFCSEEEAQAAHFRKAFNCPMR